MCMRYNAGFFSKSNASFIEFYQHFFFFFALNICCYEWYKPFKQDCTIMPMFLLCSVNLRLCNCFEILVDLLHCVWFCLKCHISMYRLLALFSKHITFKITFKMRQFYLLKYFCLKNEHMFESWIYAVFKKFWAQVEFTCFSNTSSRNIFLLIGKWSQWNYSFVWNVSPLKIFF